MSKTDDALRVFDEWPCEAGTMAELREWLEEKEEDGDNPQEWAEGMAVKVRSLKDDGRGPYGFIIWSIRNGKDDFRSFAPKATYEADSVRRIAKAIAAKSTMTYPQILEIHARGGIPWPLVNIYSSQYVERVFIQLREHAEECGFPGMRVTRKTPAFYDGEWSWEPLPSHAVVDA